MKTSNEITQRLTKLLEFISKMAYLFVMRRISLLFPRFEDEFCCLISFLNIIASTYQSICRPIAKHTGQLSNLRFQMFENHKTLRQHFIWG